MYLSMLDLEALEQKRDRLDAQELACLGKIIDDMTKLDDSAVLMQDVVEKDQEPCLYLA